MSRCWTWRSPWKLATDVAASAQAPCRWAMRGRGLLRRAQFADFRRTVALGDGDTRQEAGFGRRRLQPVGHPLEITHDLAADYSTAAHDVVQAMQLAEPMPRLAQLVAASPLEAAIHDAYGKALGSNSYNTLSREFVNADLSTYLTNEFAGEFLDRLHAAGSEDADSAVSPGRCPGSADGVRYSAARQRWIAGDAGRVDSGRRSHALEDQVGWRRLGDGTWIASCR